MAERFTYDERKIVYEALSNEVVLVNLDNGHYYILEGTAAIIWQLASARVAVHDLVRELQSAYVGDDIETAVTKLIAEWVEDGLIAPTQTPPDPAGLPELKALLPPSRPPFTAPAMFKYTDMANLIQMDPIREYDETGWPRRRGKPDLEA